MEATQISKEKIKELLDTLFDSIKGSSYYSWDVENFYQEIIKSLEATEFEDLEKFIQNLEKKILSFLKEDVHPGKLYSINAILKILPISGETFNKIVGSILVILERELEEVAKDIHYGADLGNLNLRLGCISILSTVGLYNKRFEHCRLNKENYERFLKIADFIAESENEQEIIKKEVLKIKKDLIRP